MRRLIGHVEAHSDYRQPTAGGPRRVGGLTSLFAQVVDLLRPHRSTGSPSRPLIILTGGALVLLMLAGALFDRPTGRRAPTPCLTAAVSVAALVVTFVLWDQVHGRRSLRSCSATPSCSTGPALFITVVIVASILLTALFLDDYLRREGLDGAEVYALLLMSGLGGVVMAWSSDLIVLFLGLETLSMALYVLAASHLKRLQSQESGIKYFVLGGFSSAFFLYGVALEYGATGSTRLAEHGPDLLRPGHPGSSDKGLLLAGLALLLVGFGFKVAAVPFHMWTPDVYQGAPTPVTGVHGLGLEGGRLRRPAAGRGRPRSSQFRDDWRPVIFVLAVLSLLVGSVLAIVQTNVKRMLAYSSIAHVGFILVGVEALANEPTSGQTISRARLLERPVLPARLRRHRARQLRRRDAGRPALATPTTISTTTAACRAPAPVAGVHVHCPPAGPGRRALHGRVRGQVRRDPGRRRRQAAT